MATRLGKGEAEDGDALEHAAGLRLASHTVDVGGEDQANADTGADRRQAVAQDRNVASHLMVLFRSFSDPGGPSPAGSVRCLFGCGSCW